MSKKKYIPVLIATFTWIWPALFIKFLTSHFDNVTQNFYRYLGALAVLVPVNILPVDMPVELSRFLHEAVIKSYIDFWLSNWSD